MANFIVTYDLNGRSPTHQQMDEAMFRLSSRHGRILETVWWVKASGSAEGIRDRLKVLLGREDLLLVAECRSLAWTKLLVQNAALKNAFESAS